MANKHLLTSDIPTHRGCLFRFDHIPERFPPHVFTVGPLTSNPFSHISVQFELCTTLEFVQSVGSY